jgi:hypothetical protein
MGKRERLLRGPLRVHLNGGRAREIWLSPGERHTVGWRGEIPLSACDRKSVTRLCATPAGLRPSRANRSRVPCI